MGMKSPPNDESPLFSLITFLSLSSVLAIVFTAYTLAEIFVAKSTRKIKLLFMWHAFDAILHSTIESSFLYHTFFSSVPIPQPGEKVPYPTESFTPPGVSFLGHHDRLHGTYYGSSPMAALWQEYAKADRRAGGADLTTICMELLVVFVMGPLAVYVCYLLSKKRSSKAYFWMTIIAACELYGNFMAFAPEWLTGSPNLNTSNPIYFWFYLLAFNAGLWVLIPTWVLWESYHAIGSATFISDEKVPAPSGRSKKFT